MSTAPALPLSLSPHVCVVPSPDLAQLLASSSLPPLQRLLQTFSPLPQGTRIHFDPYGVADSSFHAVTTRTTALTSVSHTMFPLRFSNLSDVEAACKEDEDARAGRAIDWIGQRIAKRAASWVERAELEGEIESKGVSTPWWEELRRCTEGDRIPTRSEGWNHPVAVIFAISTLAPNPLQAVTDLQSRYIDLPQWVDPTMLRYTLIIHTSNSPLNGDEAVALFNATKKQYGLHTHLLDLSFTVPPNPISVPSLLPELPPTPMVDTSLANDDTTEKFCSINLTEQDVGKFARFVREFVTMSLVPWMERCILDWNEIYSSNRRLHSRLFSSTRRLFGGGSTSNHVSVSPANSTAPRPNLPTSPTSTSFTGPPPQQRRLAEFATFLGDLKLAVSVWESLRKEGYGGSEVLPLLLAPSPAVGAHASYALSVLQTPDAGPSLHFRALVYAVRWEAGVRDLSNLGGERWLEWAAGFTEEPPPALLLAHAALLCSRKGAIRRAAMWYVFAAHRLEKCGIRPLTVYFLRKAHELYRMKPSKNLSPSFEDSHLEKDVDRFDAILPTIEYSLGRLMYTSGDTEGALRYFLGLLKGSPQRGHLSEVISDTDQLYLGDFKVAFEHFKSILGTNAFPTDLRLSFTFSKASETKIKLARQGELDIDAARWEALEGRWASFWKSRGRERIEKGGKAIVGERLWVDIMTQNPLGVEVTLTAFTVKVEGVKNTLDVDIEIIDKVVLRAKESRVVPVSIVSHVPASLKITHLSYSFLSLLPVTETLAVRGPRLHQTAAQRRKATYGPDIELNVDVEDGGRRLDLAFSSADGRLRSSVLNAGECLDLALKIRNSGKGNVDEIWVVHSSAVWFDLGGKDASTSHVRSSSIMSETLRSENSLEAVPPIAIPLSSLHTSSTLAPDETLDLHLVAHAATVGQYEVAVLLIFREAGQHSFYSARLHHSFDVVPILDIRAYARPSASLQTSYLVDVEIENVSEGIDVRICQVTSASANWVCSSILPQPLRDMSDLLPLQSCRIFLKSEYWGSGSGSVETNKFVLRQLGDVVRGGSIELSGPPPLDVSFSHVAESRERISACDAQLIESSRRLYTLDALAQRFYRLPLDTLPFIIPLRNPQALDIIVFWEVLSERRRGFILSPGLLLGACHAPLDEIIQQTETAKVKRTMYAETTKEKNEIIEAVRTSEWNADTDPVVVHVYAEPRIKHDFSQGHCDVPVTFIVRNFSPTNYARFVLRLQPFDSFRSSEAQHLPPCYVGALTRRGTLAPLASMDVKVKMWITRPGIYGLNGWLLETDVGDLVLEPWRTRASFRSPLAGEENIVIVIQRPS